MEQGIMIGILCIIAFIFALGFKYIAITAIRNYYSYGNDKEEN